MDLQLQKFEGPLKGEVEISGSKSESNRLLILQAFFPQITIKNLSDSDDTRVLKKALSSEGNTVDIHHAGTAMRFLTAYFAAREGKEVILTGSSRMQERPVKILVSALQSLGAAIEYVKNEGFPPLKIKGKSLSKNKVNIEAGVSSQYISALMLIAPALPEGLEITLTGSVTSEAYIEMTLQLLKKCGFSGDFAENTIRIEPAEKIVPVNIAVESDWSSASYFYSLVALSEGGSLKLTTLNDRSRQGDRIVADIYEKLGVKSTFLDDAVELSKFEAKKPRLLSLDLSNAPDLAQTIAVTCLGLGISCHLTGLHTLKIKETDRLAALKSEMEKFGGEVDITLDSLRLKPPAKLSENEKVETFSDHRMALAFAPLAVKVPLEIENAEVVSKSFPRYWETLQQLGISSKKFRDH